MGLGHPWASSNTVETGLVNNAVRSRGRTPEVLIALNSLFNKTSTVVPFRCSVLGLIAHIGLLHIEKEVLIVLLSSQKGVQVVISV